MSTAELFKQALALTENDRAALAGFLLTSLDPEPDPGLTEAWDREIHSPAAELDAGTAESVTWDELKDRLYQKLNDR
jgi:putative addiction module component (TIGR02574 family)